MTRIGRRRGVIIILTLIMSLVAFMMLGASLGLSPGRLAQAGSSLDQALAEAAIEAGIDYARARLQENPLWKADLNRVVVNTPTLYIEEDNGNVIGLLRTDVTAPFAQFRIRFNFYNGAALPDPLDDDLPDPSPAMRFDLPFVSINNLNGSVRFVPRPDAGGTVNDLLSGPLEIGPGTVALSVEGLGGNGLRETGPGSYDPPTGSRRISRRVAEVLLASEFRDGAPDAALMAGSDLDFVLPPGSGEVEILAKKAVPRARSKSNVSMNAGGGNSPNYLSNGELLFSSSGFESVTENGSTSLGDDGGAPFYELAWDDIHKASPDLDKAIQLPAGTYVFDDAGVLHYHDKTWDQYKIDEAARVLAGQPLDPGIVVSPNAANIRTDTLSAGLVELQPFKIKFEDDISIDASSSGVKDFTLVPQRGTQSQSTELGDLTSRPGSTFAKDIEIELKPGGKGKAALTSFGDILIAAKLKSSRGGSLVSEGDLRLDAGKLDDFGNVGVSFYSKQDIQVSTYEPSSGQYLQVGVDGMFYSWGDFSIRAGELGLPASAWQPIKVVGALVAYGTTNGPEVETPGTFAGTLQLVSSGASITWDSRKLGDLLDVSRQSSRTTIVRLAYTRH
jgi:hypothetical protein